MEAVFLTSVIHMPDTWAHSLLPPIAAWHLSARDILSLSQPSLTAGLQSRQAAPGSLPHPQLSVSFDPNTGTETKLRKQCGHQATLDYR